MKRKIAFLVVFAIFVFFDLSTVADDPTIIARSKPMITSGEAVNVDKENGPMWVVKEKPILSHEKNEYINIIEIAEGKEYANIYREALLRFEELNEPMDIVFLGDSLTCYGDWQSLSNKFKIANMGIEGDTIRGIEIRIDQVVKLKPKVLFLLVGINDINNMGENLRPDMYKEYEHLLNTLIRALPNTIIYVESILPVRDDVRKIASNNVLKRVNENIKLMAEERGLEYIDVFNILLNPKENRLYFEYQLDGLHLTELGYQAWYKVIQTYIDR